MGEWAKRSIVYIRDTSTLQNSIHRFTASNTLPLTPHTHTRFTGRLPTNRYITSQRSAELQKNLSGSDVIINKLDDVNKLLLLQLYMSLYILSICTNILKR